MNTKTKLLRCLMHCLTEFDQRDTRLFAWVIKQLEFEHIRHEKAMIENNTPKETV